MEKRVPFLLLFFRGSSFLCEVGEAKGGHESELNFNTRLGFAVIHSLIKRIEAALKPIYRNRATALIVLCLASANDVPVH